MPVVVLGSLNKRKKKQKKNNRNYCRNKSDTKLKVNQKKRISVNETQWIIASTSIYLPVQIFTFIISFWFAPLLLCLTVDGCFGSGFLAIIIWARDSKRPLTDQGPYAHRCMWQWIKLRLRLTSLSRARISVLYHKTYLREDNFD